MSGGSGMATALALAGGAGAMPADGQQDELFGEDHDAPMPLAPSARPTARKAGRPAGSRNRSTREMVELFLSRYQPPLMVCGEIYTRSPAELARELGMVREVDVVPPGMEIISTIPERIGAEGQLIAPKRFVVWDLEAAFRLQCDARDAALPYVHQRQPLAIEAKGNARGLLIMGDMTVHNHAPGEATALPVCFAATPEKTD